ncbi:MAG TPA: hypothetical protein VGM39_06695 [Kofleriaceae bacterium]|jgi:hypothetical protein
MAFDDLADRMKERRAPLPNIQPAPIGAEWWMGIGILLVIVGVITLAVKMGPQGHGDYRTGGAIAMVGISSIIRGMFRTRA